MNDEVKPDLFVNLGDDIEDESRNVDLERYESCQALLREVRAPLANVAGNHDTVHLNREDLNRVWRREGPLYYSFDQGPFHFVVLHTLENKDVEIRLPQAQLEWVAADLHRARSPTLVFMHHSASEQCLEDSRWFRGLSHLALVKERAELRNILEASGNVRAVFNGHVHRNHADVIRGIPYITVQSLIENLDDDAPGRAASAYAIASMDERSLIVRVGGNDPARYQFDV